MRLTGRQLSDLREIVLNAVTDEADLARLVECIDIRLQDVVEPGSLTDVVGRLLQHLETRGKLGDFIDEVIQNRPQLSQSLNPFREALARQELIKGHDSPNGRFKTLKLWTGVLGVLLIGLIVIILMRAPTQVPKMDSGVLLEKIATNARTLTPQQFTEALKRMQSPGNAYANFGRLAIVGIRDEPNGDGNWVFTAVPFDCKYLDRSNGEIRVEVPSTVLPSNFSYSTYVPSGGKYRTVEITGRMKLIDWVVNQSKGKVLILATKFTDSDESLLCP